MSYINNDNNCNDILIKSVLPYSYHYKNLVRGVRIVFVEERLTLSCTSGNSNRHLTAEICPVLSRVVLNVKEAVVFLCLCSCSSTARAIKSTDLSLQGSCFHNIT